MKKLFALIIFSLAFAFVESSVVIYLRTLFGADLGYLKSSYQMLINLGVIAFIFPKNPIFESAQVYQTEMIREFSTIVMLFSVAYIAGQRVSQKIGAFLIAFGIWDIFYYVFLRIFVDWPKRFWDTDIYFLIPVPWIGPVLTPIIISSLLIIIGLKLFLKKSNGYYN